MKRSNYVRVLVFLVLVAALVIPGAEQAEALPYPPGAADNVVLVTRYLEEAINTHDLNRIGAFVSYGAILHDPLNGDLNFEGHQAFFKTCYAVSPDFHVSDYQLIGQDEYVAALLTLEGTRAGTEAFWRVNAVNLYRIDNNKIIEVWQMYDTISWLEQLGGRIPNGGLEAEAKWGVAATEQGMTQMEIAVLADKLDIETDVEMPELAHFGPTVQSVPVSAAPSAEVQRLADKLGIDLTNEPARRMLVPIVDRDEQADQMLAQKVGVPLHDVHDMAYNEDLVDRFWKAYVTGRVDDNMFAANFMFHEPTSDHIAGLGVAEFEARSQELRNALGSGFAVIPNNSECPITQDGNLIFTAFTLTGRFIYRLGDIAPNGRTISVPGVAIFQVENGEIVEVWQLFDTVSLASQLRVPHNASFGHIPIPD